jgi:hypothetical protein
MNGGFKQSEEGFEVVDARIVKDQGVEVNEVGCFDSVGAASGRTGTGDANVGLNSPACSGIRLFPPSRILGFSYTTHPFIQSTHSPFFYPTT